MPHYYDEEQLGPLRPQQVSFSVLGRSFSVTTGSGTFSKDGLDKATSLLIESCDLRGDERVLDLGCGWGAVGIALKTVHKDVSVVMSDVNKRAVMLAKQNLEKNGIEADVRVSFAFEKIPESFNVILTNPPYAAGRKVCYQFIEESFAHLEKNGAFLLVARHQKGGKMLEAKIEDIFGNVETLAKKGGFRVYKGVKG